jgi:hypothetical protein
VGVVSAVHAPFAYRRDLTKKLMREYAAKWEGLPMPRLQLRWAPKPVPKSDPKRRKEVRERDRFSKRCGFAPIEDMAWDCFYELILPVDKWDIRNEHYGVGFIIIPISWTRRGSTSAPCEHSPTDTPYRNSAHAYWDSKVLGWPPVFVVSPDGAATMKADYLDQPKEWKDLPTAARADGAKNQPVPVAARAGQPGEG